MTMQFINKRIPFGIMLISFLMLVFGLMTKDYDGSYYNNKQKIPPLDLFDVSLFGWDISYKNFMLFFIITLGVGVYLMVYKSDENLKEGLKNLKKSIKAPKFLVGSKSKDKIYEKKHSTVLPENAVKGENRAIIKIVEVITLFALVFTFYMSVKKGFSLWFFIILSYFYYLILEPKSIKQIRLKAFFYPLPFMLIIASAESGDIYYRFLYYLSKHMLPYLTSVAIIFFTQKHKLYSKPNFSFKHTLFRASLLCFIAAILHFILEIP